MRLLIALTTVVGFISIAAMEADGPPKKEDIPKFRQPFTVHSRISRRQEKLLEFSILMPIRLRNTSPLALIS